MDYLKIAGSLAMWLCVVPAILVVVVQAAMFARKAYKCGLEIGMTKAQLKSAIRASAVSSIGPSLAILSGMLALLGIAGGPIPGCVFPTSATWCLNPWPSTSASPLPEPLRKP